MAVACFNLQERLLPALRAETARRLNEKGLRQARIAEHLGVSQAMVSKYLRHAPRPPEGTPATLFKSWVEEAVRRSLQAEQKGVLPPWCPLCTQFEGGNGVSQAAELQECLRGDRLPKAEAGLGVLENLRQAERRMHGADFAKLAPEVRINLAMATPDARDARGVGAFPGRLVNLKGEIRSVSEPEFGASNHLADVLLRVRRQQPAVAAILCVRDDDRVRRALREAGLRYRLLKRQRSELVISVHAQERPDALIDPGAFGIEPVTYVLGETALEAVDKAQRLLAHLPSTQIAR